MSSSVENADAPDVRLQYLGDLVSSSRVKVLLILGSMLVNGMFYKSLPSRYSPLVKSYIVSSFHAFVSVFTVANYFLRCEINLKQINRLLGGGVTGTSDELIFVSVCYSSGYLMYDFLLMLICKSVRTGSALLHHVLILLSFCSGLFHRICLPCHFYLLAEELSTIPLNLKSLYRHHPSLYQLFSILFVVCFFLSRLLYGSIICAYAFHAAPAFLRWAWHANEMNAFLLAVGQATLCLSTRLLNIYWAFLIVQKLFESKPRTSQL